MVAAAAIPGFKAGIGAKLYHAKWQRCTGKSMPMPTRAYKRVNIPGVIILGIKVNAA